MISNNSLQAVLFDLDGTLVDTALDFFLVADKFCKEYSFSKPANERIKQEVSNGSLAITQLLTKLDKEHNEIKRYQESLLEFYTECLGQKAKPYKGILELLELLKQNHIAWGVVTNKPLQYSKPLMQALKLDTDCQVLICPDHVTETKPSPEPILLALEKLQCNAEQSVYIGDHERDIIAGRAAQTTTIAAAYGYITNSEQVSQWQADYTAECSNDICKIIQALIQ